MFLTLQYGNIKLIYLFELITACLLEIRIPFNYLLTLENIHDSKYCGVLLMQVHTKVMLITPRKNLHYHEQGLNSEAHKNR